jgi:hypothetical protein
MYVTITIALFLSCCNNVLQERRSSCSHPYPSAANIAILLYIKAAPLCISPILMLLRPNSDAGGLVSSLLVTD